MFHDPCKIPNDTHVVWSFTDNSAPKFTSGFLQSEDPELEATKAWTERGKNLFFYSGKKGGKQMEARILGMYDKYMYSSGLHRFVFVTKKMVIIFKILA